MKKTYFAPETKILTVEINQMICVSGELDTTKSIKSPSGFGSRGDSSWDDDEY